MWVYQRLLCAALTAFLTTSSASAATPPAPATTGSPGPSEVAACPVYVAHATRAGVDGEHAVYAFALGSEDADGRASGTIDAYDGATVYRLPFHEATATVRDAAATATPLVYALPANAHIDGAIVSSLGTPPGPCDVHRPWQPTPSQRSPQPPTLPDRLALRAAKIAPQLPQATLSDPLNCAVPNAPAKPIKMVPPEIQGPGMVVLEIALGADSRVNDVLVTQSTSPALNNRTILAARASTFQTRVFRCRPIPTVYTAIFRFGVSRQAQ